MLMVTCYTLTRNHNPLVVLGAGNPFVGCHCKVIWLAGPEVKGHRSVVEEAMRRQQPGLGFVL